jgi:hypothetical protein
MTRSSARVVFRAVLAVAVATIAAASLPAVSLADHCGADAKVTPESGPVGTAFRIEPRLGGPTTIRLFLDGSFVAIERVIADEPLVFSYTPRIAGPWTARSTLIGSPECASVAPFTVTVAAPDTDTSEPNTPRGEEQALNSLLVLAAALTLGVSFLRRTATATKR